jgi:hypothetical protein
MKEVPLTRGYVAVIDDADYDRVMAAGAWHAHRQRKGMYALHTVYIKGSKPHKWLTLRMHRFILGVTDPKIDVDHRDHNGLNNRRANLRVATRSQNRANGRKPRGTSSTFKGVSFHKKLRKWQAYITANGKRTYLGLFEREADAAFAYYSAALKYFGEFTTTSLSPKETEGEKVESLGREVKREARTLIRARGE